MFILLTRLEHSDQETYQHTYIQEEELRNIFQNSPANCPEEILQTKPATKDHNKILMNSALYHHPNEAYLGPKVGRTAKCRKCGKELGIGELCIKLEKVLCVKFDDDSTRLETIYVHPTRSCTINFKPWYRVVLPRTIKAHKDITQDTKDQVASSLDILIG